MLPATRLACHVQGVGHPLLSGLERDLLGLQVRWAHIDPDLLIFLQVQPDIATGGTDGYLGAACQPLVVHKAGKTTGPVAALFDLAAVGIEYAVIEFGVAVS